MHNQRTVPVLVAALLAVVGTAVVFFNGLSPNEDPQDRASARIATAAAVSRAGAIQIPSELANDYHSLSSRRPEKAEVGHQYRNGV